MDPTRPLWDLTYVPKLDDGSALLMLRIQHCYADGVGLAMLLMQGMGEVAIETGNRQVAGQPDDAKMPSALAHWLRDRRDTARWLLRSAGTFLFRPAERASMMEQIRIARHSLANQEDRSVRKRLPRSAERTLILREAGPVSTWHAEARRQGGTINDLFLAFAASCIHRYYEVTGNPTPHIVAVMPINDRGIAGTQHIASEQRSAQIVIHQSIKIASDLEGIREVSLCAQEIGTATISPFVGRLLSFLPRPIRRRMNRDALEIADIVASNMVVPTLGVCGQPFSKLFTLGPAMGNVAFFALATFRDHVHISITVDPGQAEPAKLEQIAEEELARWLPQR